MSVLFQNNSVLTLYSNLPFHLATACSAVRFEISDIENTCIAIAIEALNQVNSSCNFLITLTCGRCREHNRKCC